MKKRVLMLGWEYPPLINGGLGVACQGLARALAPHVDLTIFLPVSLGDNEDSVNVTNVACERSSKLSKLQSLGNIQEIPTELHPYLEGSPNPTLWAGDLYGPDLNQKVIDYAQKAAALATETNFDLIHAHDWMTFLAGLEIKAWSGKPLVLHVHSLQYDRVGPACRDWIFEIEQNAMQAADLVIPVSSYSGQIAHQVYGVPNSKIHPVHNGVEAVTPFQSPKPFPEKLVLFLGRLTAQKGPELFLEIAAKVLAETKDVTFAMAGSGERLAGLIEYGAYHNLGDRLHFTGFLERERVHHLLSMTDVYCMPSVSEPFGLSALEAAQFGIPAVISRQSGVAEVLRHARVADYWDTDGMARHIIKLVTNPLAHGVASKAALEDQSRCTWERAAAEVLKLYDTIL